MCRYIFYEDVLYIVFLCQPRNAGHLDSLPNLSLAIVTEK